MEMLRRKDSPRDERVSALIALQIAAEVLPDTYGATFIPWFDDLRPHIHPGSHKRWVGFYCQSHIQTYASQSLLYNGRGKYYAPDPLESSQDQLQQRRQSAWLVMTSLPRNGVQTKATILYLSICTLLFIFSGSTLPFLL